MRPRANQGEMRSKVNTIMPIERIHNVPFQSVEKNKFNVQWSDLSYITTALNHGNRVPAVTDPV